MGYIRKRFSQPSTWLGLGMGIAALVATGGSFTPEVISTLLGALGLVHIDEVKA